MGLDDWQAVGIVAGSITAVLVLVALVVRGALRMFRSVRGTVKRLNHVADDLLGDRGRGVPSIVERVQALDRKLSDHIRDRHQPTQNGSPTAPSQRRW